MVIDGISFQEVHFQGQWRCSLIGDVPVSPRKTGVRYHSKIAASILNLLARLGLIENKIHAIAIDGQVRYLNRNSLTNWLETQPQRLNSSDLNVRIQDVINCRGEMLRVLPDEF